MKTYKLDPEALARVKRQIYPLFGALALMILVLACWRNRDSPFALLGVSLLGAVLLFLVGRAAKRAVEQKREYWERFELQVAEDVMLLRERVHRKDESSEHRCGASAKIAGGSYCSLRTA